MRFWDSSALVPLLIEEPRSANCRALHRADRAVTVWVLTRTELVSAIRRVGREGRLDRQGATRTLAKLELLSATWTEVEGISVVRERAERVLGVHALSAADALQLAAALVVCRELPRGRMFVTADDQLARAAEAEGFDVVAPKA